MKMILSLALVVLSFLGILDASYLTYEKFMGVVPPCTANFRCGDVLNSKWASIGPVPLSLFGVGFYAAVFLLSVLYVGEIRKLSFLGREWQVSFLLRLLTLWGFIFSGFLLYLMAYVIQAWCLYCLVSAGISISLFVVTNLLFWRSTEST